MSSSDGLRPEDWEKIESVGEKLTVEAGHLLFEPGQPSDYVMWVIEGSVEVQNSEGKAVAELGPGEMLGEISYIDFGYPSARVQTATLTQLLVVEVEKLAALADEDDGLGSRLHLTIATAMAGRVRALLSLLPD